MAPGDMPLEVENKAGQVHHNKLKIPTLIKPHRDTGKLNSITHDS